MSKLRFMFKKYGRSKYISHLDLMRTMQRVFKRAGVPLRHSEGFNPHPLISIILPLSVGMESDCEYMDAELVEGFESDELIARLQAATPEGIDFISVYLSANKPALISWIDVTGRLDYDIGATEKLASDISDYFRSESIIITKKTKRGTADVDIIPCIKSISFTVISDKTLELRAVISAQNPSLNPELIISALRTHRAELAPDFACFKRNELFKEDMTVFR